MADSKKLVLMVQPTKLQGLIWQAVLKSQGLSVIWESPDANVTESMEQLNQAGLTLPDLLLIDVRLKVTNAYDLCRWCRDHYSAVKVILTDCSRSDITDYERRWAIYQGATDFLPAFQRENLVSHVAAGVKRVLEVLDGHPLDNGALISILLTMKRQIEANDVVLSAVNEKLSAATSSPPPQATPRQPPTSANGSANGSASSAQTHTNGKTPPPDPQPAPSQSKLSYRFAKYPKKP